MVPTTWKLYDCAEVYVPFNQSSAVWSASHLGTTGRRLSTVEPFVMGAHVQVAPSSQVTPWKISRLPRLVLSSRGLKVVEM